MNNIEKLKHCKYGKHDLPLTEFSSTRAKYCTTCKRIRALEMQKQSRLRSIERLKTKVKKTKKKAKTKTLAQWKKTTQRVFNKWIRTRDEGRGCISCLKKTSSVWHAGHYLSVGSKSALRYEENNCHLQCLSCNTYKHGNLVLYRINLVDKIGEEQVKKLENRRNEIKKWTREELKRIRDDCRKKMERHKGV